MPAMTTIELLLSYASAAMDQARERDAKVMEVLGETAGSALVNAVRISRLQKIVFAVGMFSLYEGLLQARWEQEPFVQLKDFLIEHDRADLAQRFSDYQDAINALKHGRGRSYNRLLKRADNLDFQVKREGEGFIREGDISEVDSLIDVDERFVRHCAELIAQTVRLLREKIPNQFLIGTLPLG